MRNKNMKTAKEYFMEQCKVDTLDDLYTLHYSELFAWMEEYAAQIKVDPPSDEEIKMWIDSDYSDGYDIDRRMGAEEGAKWMRDKMTKQ